MNRSSQVLVETPSSDILSKASVAPKYGVGALLGIPSSEGSDIQDPGILALTVDTNIGASIIRTGFWGPLYYNHNKEPPK